MEWQTIAESSVVRESRLDMCSPRERSKSRRSGTRGFSSESMRSLWLERHTDFILEKHSQSSKRGLWRWYAVQQHQRSSVRTSTWSWRRSREQSAVGCPGCNPRETSTTPNSRETVAKTSFTSGNQWNWRGTSAQTDVFTIELSNPLSTDLWRKPQTNGFHEFILFSWMRLEALFKGDLVAADENLIVRCSRKLNDMRPRIQAQEALYSHTPCRTHIFRHIFFERRTHRVRTWLKVCAVRMSLSLSISLSPLSCFILRLCCSRTVISRPPSFLLRPRLPCRTSPDLKAKVKRTSARGPGKLATWPIQRTQPKEFDNITSADGDSTPINPNYDHISASLENHTREHWIVRCFHNVRSLCFARFSRWKKRQHASENRCQREKGNRRMCGQCCRVDVKEKSTEQYQKSFSSGSQRIMFWWMWSNEDLNKPFLFKIQLRERFIWLSTTWRVRI